LSGSNLVLAVLQQQQQQMHMFVIVSFAGVAAAVPDPHGALS